MFCTIYKTYNPLCNNVGAHRALVENQEARVENLSLHLKALLLLFSRSVMSVSLQPHGLKHARLPCPSLSLGVCSNSCDAIQPSHPLLPPSPPALNLSQHQGLFQWVSSSHQVAKVLKLQLQHQSFQWIFRTDFLWDWLVWSLGSPRNSQESSPAPQFVSINSSAFSLLYGSTLMSVHDYRKNHSFDHTDLCQQSDVSSFKYAL